MQHLQLKIGVVLDFFPIEGNHIIVADAQTRGVELEPRFLLGSDTDADLAFRRNLLLQQHIELLFAVEHRDGVHIALSQKFNDVVDINLTLESVTYNIVLLVEKAGLVKGLNQVDVKRGRGFNMHIVLQHLRHHKLEMIALCAITIVITALVIGLCNSHIEPSFGLLDILGYLGQIGDFQRRSILFDDIHQWYVIE